MAKHTAKILRCEHRKNFKVCLAILQHYVLKGLKNYHVLGALILSRKIFRIYDDSQAV